MTVSNTCGDVVRGCANYKPTIWDYEYLQSLKSEYLEKKHLMRLEVLKAEVKMMLNEEVLQPLNQLRLVDALQRLGVGYHFQHDIRRILESFHNQNEESKAEWKKDLYATALEFRLLRQNGYKASIDTFKQFKDENDEIGSNACMTAADVDALLALYDASFLCVRSESVLRNARDVASKHLKHYLENHEGTTEVKACLVRHALEIPLHWRMQRVEARWFIDAYERMDDMNPTLLEFAKLDFNIVQAIHQEEIKEVSRWWKDSDLCNSMSFARDRLIECFIWSMGLRYEPIHGYYRVTMAKLLIFLTIIDDLYDVPYGTAEEVELFTMAIRSWKLDAMDTLPDYLKVLFLGFYNCVNESVFFTLKEQGFYVMKYVQMAWADVCNAYWKESKWLRAKYRYTSLQEYIDNAWHSIGLQAPVYGAYFMMANPLTDDIVRSFKEFPSFFLPASMVLRLADDIGSYSREQGQSDISNAVFVHMKDTGSTLEEAVEHVRLLIEKCWEDMNEDLIGGSDLPYMFVETAMNGSRTAIIEYQQGDGFTIQNQWNKDLTLSLYINPIPMS